MPDTIVRAPVARDYKEPGEFIHAWRKFTLGEQIPAPTAAGMTGGIAQLGNMIKDSLERYLQPATRNQNRYFWDHVNARRVDTIQQLAGVLNDENNAYIMGNPFSFVSDWLREQLPGLVRPAIHRLCKKSASFRSLNIEVSRPDHYQVRHNPEHWGHLVFGDFQMEVMTRISLSFVPPRCVNTREVVLGAPRDLARWIQQFQSLQDALAWLGIDASRALRHGRYRGVRRDEYVPGSDPGFWVPDAGKLPARALVASLTPFQRTNP